MTFEVGVVARFTARHHLVGNFGPASLEHSHNYRVEALVRGPELQEDGTLLDISVLQRGLSDTLARLEGQDLNAIQALAEPNPSAEVVAHYIHHAISESVTGLEALTIRVWESDEAFAAYTTSRK
jgi:6-pyruvoyltetrahydropterin/6-carboxytetrahydropterin synthase